MNNSYQALSDAHSSQVRIENRSGGAVIVKTVTSRERKNEIAFHRLLRELGLPAMTVVEEKEDLIISFVPDAETLEDSPSPENYKKLGSALRVLYSYEYPDPVYLDSDGQSRAIEWRSFLSERALRGSKRAGFPEDVIGKILQQVSALPMPRRIVPIHGDLHANNVLLRGDEVYLFDKADQIFAGDPIYDLALFGINLPGVYGLGSEIDQDIALMEALELGCGENFMSNRDLFDRYVLLRALERHPNPFESETARIVENIISRLA